MTIPQDPQQVPVCQVPGPTCVPTPIVPDAVFVCGGDQQIDQCTGPTQTGETPVIPATTFAPVITVPTSTPAALQLPSTGSPSAPISGLAAALLIVGIVFARIGRLASAR